MAIARHRIPQGRVVEWRACRLRGVGLDRDTADAVAADSGYDLHALLELIDRGCPPELALRIVAPLEPPEVAP